MKIFLTDKEDHKKLIQELEEKGANFHFFPPKEDIPITIVVKGIHSTFTPDEVEDEFSNIFPNITLISVSRFITRKNGLGKGEREPPYLPNMFKITVAPGSDINDIVKTKIFLNQIVKWEKPFSQGPLQCHRCQEIGHLAINCRRSFVCVKCAKNHGPGNCQLNKEELPLCANCGQKGHPASYRGCIYFNRYLKNLKPKKKFKL